MMVIDASVWVAAHMPTNVKIATRDRSSAHRCGPRPFSFRRCARSAWVADVHYAVSKQFLRRAIAQGAQLAAPVLLPVEVAAAVTRGAGQRERAKRLVHTMLKLPALRLHPMDSALAIRSVRMAVAVQLRGADAVYAALAEALRVPLISWDNEHLTRASQRIPVYTPLTMP